MVNFYENGLTGNSLTIEVLFVILSGKKGVFMLSLESLKGVWAALITAWDEKGCLDEKIYREDIRSCCKAKVHGVYTGGSTGEFYAQDFELFKRINSIVREETKRFNIPFQVGCTAISTKEVLKRAEFAVEIKADGIQVALPFWLALTNEEIVEFFEEIYHSFPLMPVISYNTGRSKRFLSFEDYQNILRKAPTLIGVKQTGKDLSLIPKLADLPLSIFTGEDSLADAMKMGAKGSYSSFVYFNPRIILNYYRLCEEKKWEEAVLIQKKIYRIVHEGLGPLIGKGYQDSALDRVLGKAAGFLKCGLMTQLPYRAVKEEEFLVFKNWVEKNEPEFLVL